MSSRPEAVGRELLPVSVGTTALFALAPAWSCELSSSEWAERAYALAHSTHAAVDRAVDKACSRLGTETLFDVRFRQFANIVAGRNK